jgi:hypothetical protein
MSIFYAYILVIRIALYPDLPPIVVDTFELRRECTRAGEAIDRSTTVKLIISCETRV